MKKILYLHGLESKQGGEKVGFLAGQACVYAPAMSYADSNIEKQLIKIVKAFKPDVIIGSSMGGYSAMLLGNYFNIKTIAFNPAFHSRTFDPNFNKLSNADPDLGFTPVVVLGMEDKVINPLLTKEILDDAFIDCNIEEIEGMGHRVDPVIFIDIYNKYKNG
tara:strand:+ start:819 stop:1304 length:486 start_codon:yes stop_codon:yes gene_type:complete